jgi:hypothetical protein
MAEKIIDPDDHLSDIVATRRWAYLDDKGALQFTDSDSEASEHWHAAVVVGDYVPKTLPLQSPRDWVEPKFPGDDEPRSLYPRWVEWLQRSRNGVEIVVASIMAGTTGALIGWAIAHAG